MIVIFLFVGKVILLGGDFHQVLSIVPRETREEIINASLLKSYLWPKFTKIRLTKNIRAELDPLISEYLLRIGNEVEKICYNECIKLPPAMIIPYAENINTLNILIDNTLANINKYTNNFDFMMNRVICQGHVE